METAFTQRRAESGGIEVTIAERGEERESDCPDARFPILLSGRRYDGVSVTSSFRIMEFTELGISCPLPGVEDVELEPQATLGIQNGVHRRVIRLRTA